MNGHQNGVLLALPRVTYGFIGKMTSSLRIARQADFGVPLGIGVMGLPMARNLRAKIPQSSRLVICDVVEAQTHKFLAENKSQGEVQIAATPKEVAEQAVGQNLES